MPYIGHPLQGKHKFVNKFGQSPAVSAGEDIWDGGIAYPFQSSAAVPAMVSADSTDNQGGVGARSVTIEGVDASNNELIETANMHATDGTISVNFIGSFLQIHRAYVATAGSSLTNAGNITISLGGTTVALILASNGQTLMSVYTVAADYRYAHLAAWYADLQGGVAASVDLQLQVRESGGAWRVRDTMSLTGNANSSMMKVYPFWEQIPTGANVRIRVAAISAGTPVVASNFCMALPYIV
jgi:hypothetical protein